MRACGRLGRPVLPPTIRAHLDSASVSPKAQVTQGISISSSSSSSRAPEQVQGWLRSVRAHKNVVFAEVSDGSNAEGLQAVFKGPARVAGLDGGASVRLHGKLVESRGGGQAKEFLVDKTEVLGGSDPEVYPIQKKSLPPPVLREMAHLRFRTSQTAAVMRLRDAMMRDWHDWFEKNEFVHIHTPVLTSSDCEGAGETFGVTTSGASTSATASDPSGAGDVHSKPPPTLSAPIASSSPSSPRTQPEPFFPRPVNLTVSSQLHLEAPTHSLSRTYTLSPCFRAEPSLTSRHLSEFHMLEGEVVLDTLEQLMDVVEDGIRSVLARIVGGEGKRWEGMRRDLERLGPDNTKLGEFGRVAERPFHRITYGQAIEHLTTVHESGQSMFEIPPRWEEGLASEHEKYLATKYGPTFVTHYPRHLKPFYMLPSSADRSYSPSPSSARDGETVACFDLLFPEVGELAGGSMREHRLDELERAIEAHGLDKERYRWYLDLRRYGSVPHGGWGMGWDRWISWVTGVGNLRDVVAFPRWKGHCDY